MSRMSHLQSIHPLDPKPSLLSATRRAFLDRQKSSGSGNGNGNGGGSSSSIPQSALQKTTSVAAYLRTLPINERRYQEGTAALMGYIQNKRTRGKNDREISVKLEGLQAMVPASLGPVFNQARQRCDLPAYRPPLPTVPIPPPPTIEKSYTPSFSSCSPESLSSPRTIRTISTTSSPASSNGPMTPPPTIFTTTIPSLPSMNSFPPNSNKGSPNELRLSSKSQVLLFPTSRVLIHEDGYDDNDDEEEEEEEGDYKFPLYRFPIPPPRETSSRSGSPSSSFGSSSSSRSRKEQRKDVVVKRVKKPQEAGLIDVFSASPKDILSKSLEPSSHRNTERNELPLGEKEELRDWEDDSRTVTPSSEESGFDWSMTGMDSNVEGESKVETAKKGSTSAATIFRNTYLNAQGKTK